MNKLTPLAVLTSTLIAGCGGGGGGGSAPAPTYSLEFASFYIEKASSSNASCSVYSEEIFYKEPDPNKPDEEPIVDYKNVVLATKVISPSVRVAIHDSNGRFVKEFVPGAAEWKNGKLSFKQSEIPSNGYLTTYQLLQRNNIVFLDAVSYQKSFLDSSMIFTTPPATLPEDKSCVTTGVKPPKFTERKQTFDDRGEPTGVFGFNSPDENYWSVSPLNAEFEIANKPLLAVRYDRHQDDTLDNINESESETRYRALREYRFITSANLGTKPLELKEIGDSTSDDTPQWVPPQDSTLTNAKLFVKYSGYSYLWQTLPAVPEQFSYASSIGGSSYYLQTEGGFRNWGFNKVARVSTLSNGIDESTTLSGLNIPPYSPLSLSACGTSTSEVGACLRTYQQPDTGNAKIQRNFVNVDDNAGGQIRHTIYSKPTDFLGMFSFNNSVVDGIWSDQLVNAKVSLLYTSDSKVIDTLLKSHRNPMAIAQDTYNDDTNVDSFGFLVTDYEASSADSALSTQDYLLLNNTLK
ncbi:TPA: hypothetical protein I7213_18025 [Vibrio vulnificus]|nr:hypothetical protein [Vibrio vulnificus]HDY7580444.1 hypothetical protein [Vibrio vulnificus]